MHSLVPITQVIPGAPGSLRRNRASPGRGFARDDVHFLHQVRVGAMRKPDRRDRASGPFPFLDRLPDLPAIRGNLELRGNPQSMASRRTGDSPREIDCHVKDLLCVDLLEKSVCGMDPRQNENAPFRRADRFSGRRRGLPNGSLSPASTPHSRRTPGRAPCPIHPALPATPPRKRCFRPLPACLRTVAHKAGGRAPAPPERRFFIALWAKGPHSVSNGLTASSGLLLRTWV
jgi:hypothetical protein